MRPRMFKQLMELRAIRRQVEPWRDTSGIQICYEPGTEKDFGATVNSTGSATVRKRQRKFLPISNVHLSL